ncbi:MAG: hypothetical protein U0U66_05615 [Cytophagaceae bacterium]
MISQNTYSQTYKVDSSFKELSSDYYGKVYIKYYKWDGPCGGEAGPATVLVCFDSIGHEVLYAEFADTFYFENKYYDYNNLNGFCRIYIKSYDKNGRLRKQFYNDSKFDFHCFTIYKYKLFSENKIKSVVFYHGDYNNPSYKTDNCYTKKKYIYRFPPLVFYKYRVGRGLYLKRKREYKLAPENMFN